MGRVETFKGIDASALPEEMRERLGLRVGDVVDLDVRTRAAGTTKNLEELDAIIARAQDKARGSGVTAENCTDFLYDEDGLPG